MDREASAAELDDLAERVRNGSAAAFIVLEVTVPDPTVHFAPAIYTCGAWLAMVNGRTCLPASAPGRVCIGTGV